MRIDRIQVKNFKGFEDQNFEFKSRFSVLIGENASGKTSVLDALAVAMGSFFLGLEEVKPRNIKADEIRLLTIDGQPKPQKPVEIKAYGQIDGQNIEWSRTLDRKNTTNKDAKQLKNIAAEKLKESRRENRDVNKITFPLLCYHGTGRLHVEHEATKYQTQIEGILRGYNNALSIKSSSLAFLNWYKTQEDEIFKFGGELEKAHLQAFQNCILELVPDQRWQKMYFSRKDDNLFGIFTDLDQKQHRLPYTQLSDGYRSIISLAADLAYRCIQLNPHLGQLAVKDTPGIVLIDELDLHLHPNWQKRIVADLKRVFPKVQFVATTHSPFIIQSLDAHEVMDLRKDNHEVPKDLSLSKVVTQIMGVDGLRSDDFDARYQFALDQFRQLNQSKELTLDDYAQLAASLVKSEVNDPIYKAYLDYKNR